ncbi:hypothetical protein A8O28_04500 [Enterobacteriaceae bacterium CCUG 67584]|nr:hypothetical protein [Enterobacteriaceae bacterium CCUG 67584]
MNKLEFNALISGLGPVAADAYSQEMAESYPEIVAPSLQYTLCSKQNYMVAENWPNTSAFKDGYGGWSWEDIYHRAKYSTEKFIVAVSSNGVFGGLFSGKLLADEVELQFVQRDIRCDSLKGFMIPASITYGAILGQAMGRGVLTICEPAPELVERYRRSMKGEVGYKLGQKGAIASMSVKVDEVLTPPTNQ